ncbi:MAG: DUF1573 domain-containing protein [Pirellulales bacterium]
MNPPLPMHPVPPHSALRPVAVERQGSVGSRTLTRRAWLVAGSLAAVAGLSAPRRAVAQQWARKMFKVFDHDFGTVARGAKSEFLFEFENSWEETVHVASVRTSCGCTSASITKDTLKTWEKGGILATFNTASFTGQRSATITVTFDKPFFAEVQLNVQGNIRTDVVFTPGSVDFGVVDAGQSASKKVAITYAGRSDWQISDVRSANSNFEVELQETQRSGGRVAYEMSVFMKPDMPEGFFQEQLILVTSDARTSGVPLVVEGRVVPGLTVSPASLFLGVLKPGQKVTKQLVVKGKQPFKILDIRTDDPRLEFDVSAQQKALHIVPVHFTAGEKDEKISATIEIETSLGSSNTARCAASATIRE